MAKETGTFKGHTRIPLNLIIEKNSCRQKRNKNEQFLQISVHAVHYDDDEMRHIPTKNFSSNNLWSNQFRNPMANNSVKVQHEKTST